MDALVQPEKTGLAGTGYIALLTFSVNVFPVKAAFSL